MGDDAPRLQIAPVLERLVLPRARAAMEQWLNAVAQLDGLAWLVPAHYAAPLQFSADHAIQLLNSVKTRRWAPNTNDWTFLATLDQQLLKRGIVPAEPERAD